AALVHRAGDGAGGHPARLAPARLGGAAAREAAGVSARGLAAVRARVRPRPPGRDPRRTRPLPTGLAPAACGGLARAPASLSYDGVAPVGWSDRSKISRTVRSTDSSQPGACTRIP